jgi:hypothetical protein
MLSDMARTRPRRSPSQPNNTPPVAAPIRKTAIMTPNHSVFTAGFAATWLASNSSSALGPMSGNMPISKPSNSHPKNAAISAGHLPRSPADVEIGVEVIRDESFRSGFQPRRELRKSER